MIPKFTKFLLKNSRYWLIISLGLILTLAAGSVTFLASERVSSEPNFDKKDKVDLSSRFSDFPEDAPKQPTAESQVPGESDGQLTSQLASEKSLLEAYRPSQGCPRLQPILYDMTLETYQERYALSKGIQIANGRARVIIVITSATGSLPSGYYISTINRYKANFLVDMPIYLLCSLANESDVAQVRIPTLAEQLDLSGQTGNGSVAELLEKGKKGYTPTPDEFKKYNIDPELYYDLVQRLKKSDIKVTSQ